MIPPFSSLPGDNVKPPAGHESEATVNLREGRHDPPAGCRQPLTQNLREVGLTIQAVGASINQTDTSEFPNTFVGTSCNFSQTLHTHDLPVFPASAYTL